MITKTINPTKQIIVLALLTFGISATGCGTMMVLLGDNIRYSISGKVQSKSSDQTHDMSENEKGIANVAVKLKCQGFENSIYQNRTGITDENGRYELKGYWDLVECSIHFNHDNYKPTVVTIDNSHVTSLRGLSIKYEVNVKLQAYSNK